MWRDNLKLKSEIVFLLLLLPKMYHFCLKIRYQNRTVYIRNTDSDPKTDKWGGYIIIWTILVTSVYGYVHKYGYGSRFGTENTGKWGLAFKIKKCHVIAAFLWPGSASISCNDKLSYTVEVIKNNYGQLCEKNA